MLAVRPVSVAPAALPAKVARTPSVVVLAAQANFSRPSGGSSRMPSIDQPASSDSLVDASIRSPSVARPAGGAGRSMPAAPVAAVGGGSGGGSANTGGSGGDGDDFFSFGSITPWFLGWVALCYAAYYGHKFMPSAKPKECCTPAPAAKGAKKDDKKKDDKKKEEPKKDDKKKDEKKKEEPKKK